MFGAQGDDGMYAADFQKADTAGSRMFGGAGNDFMMGSDKWDRMQGGPGEDILEGFEGRDWLRGGADRDSVSGGPGIDDVHGGNGGDFLDIEGNDTVRGGAGNDICARYFNPVNPQVRSCESTFTASADNEASALSFRALFE